MAESWTPLLEAGDPEAAWDRFIERYRRLIFGVIHRCDVGHDAAMDRVTCTRTAQRERGSARLRSLAARLSEPDDRETWQPRAARVVDRVLRPVPATLKVST